MEATNSEFRFIILKKLRCFLNGGIIEDKPLSLLVFRILSLQVRSAQFPCHIQTLKFLVWITTSTIVR